MVTLTEEIFIRKLYFRAVFEVLQRTAPLKEEAATRVLGLRLQQRCFSCETCEIFGVTYFEKHVRMVASVKIQTKVFHELRWSNSG